MTLGGQDVIHAVALLDVNGNILDTQLLREPISINNAHVERWEFELRIYLCSKSSAELL